MTLSHFRRHPDVDGLRVALGTTTVNLAGQVDATLQETADGYVIKTVDGEPLLGTFDDVREAADMLRFVVQESQEIIVPYDWVQFETGPVEPAAKKARGEA